MILLTLMLACSGSPVRPAQTGGDADVGDGGSSDSATTDGGVADGGAEDDPSEYVHEEEEIQPLLSLEEVEAAIDEAIVGVRGLDPNAPFDALAYAVAAGDSDCPYYYDDYYELYGYDYWYGGCTASNGATFDGSIYGQDYADGELDYGAYKYHRYGWWYGDFAAETADAQTFDLTGYFYYGDYEYTYGLRYFSFSFTGESLGSGESLGGGWTDDGLSLSIEESGGYYASYGPYISLNGGVGGFDGTVNSVYFDGVYMGAEGWGSSCPTEPSGVISVRDADGQWYYVMVDGPAYAGASSFEPYCDGCGEVWYRGESLGEVCPGFDQLLDWEGAPW